MGWPKQGSRKIIWLRAGFKLTVSGIWLAEFQIPACSIACRVQIIIEDDQEARSTGRRQPGIVIRENIGSVQKGSHASVGKGKGELKFVGSSSGF